MTRPGAPAVSRQDPAAGRAAALTALGPFFAVHLRGGRPALPGPWRPLTALASPAGLAGPVAQTRAALAAGPARRPPWPPGWPRRSLTSAWPPG